MSRRIYIVFSGTVFGIVAILHLLRAIAGWPAQIGTLVVPMWASWVSLLVAGYLAISAFVVLRKES